MRIRAFLCLALFGVAPSVAASGPFTTWIGDSNPATISAVATDSAGNTYVVGTTQLTGVPSFLNSAIGAQGHVFVTKLDPNGSVLFTDTFAGQGVDNGSAIAVDPLGNIYIAGMTTSPDFPISHALQTQIFTGTLNGVAVGSSFLMKLSNDGSAILYSTFFGGTQGQSGISSLAIDANGNLYLTGYTWASDLPHTAGMPFGTISQSPAMPGVMIASLSASGDKILWSGAIPLLPSCSTCIGSGGIEWQGVGIAVDPARNVYIAGNAGNTTGLPTTPGVLAPNGSGPFVAKIDAGGSGLAYLTYLTPPTTYNTTLLAIAVDGAGNAYLGGQSDDPNFPTPGSFLSNSAEASANPGFLAKLNPDASVLVWASYFDIPQSVALDGAGNVWANGHSVLPLPNQNGWTTGSEFLAALNPAGSQLVYSALYPYGTVGQSMALDPSGILHTVGHGGFVSAIAPFTAPETTISYFANAAGGAATAQLSPWEEIAIYGPGIGPPGAVAMPSGGFYPTTLAGVEVTVNGIEAPLLYAGPNQINAMVPMELATNAAATVRLTNGAIVSSFPVWIVPRAPVAYQTVVNQDGTVNSQTNPAKGGSVVTFWATGWQSSFFPLADGQVQTMAEDACQGNCVGGFFSLGPPLQVGFPFAERPLPATVQDACRENCPADGVRVTPVGSPSATVLYGGDAPGIVAGITQFNVQIGAVPSSAGTENLGLNVQGPASALGPGYGVSVTLWVIP